MATKINRKDFMDFNEERAFTSLFNDVRSKCIQKFKSKIDDGEEGWDENSDTVRENILTGLIKHVNRIDAEEYSEDDIIDAINYLVMLYNLGEKEE